MKRLLLAALFGLMPLPALAADLIMVEQAGCHWCARWNADIAHIYPKTEEGQRAPLRRVDLRDLPPDITFKARFSPQPLCWLRTEPSWDGSKDMRVTNFSGSCSRRF